MKKHKFKLLDGVVAVREIMEPQLMGAWGRGKRGEVDGEPAVLKGTRGVVVDVQRNTPDIAVEFFDDEGETIDVAFIPEDYVRAETPEEVEATRALTARLNAGQ